MPWASLWRGDECIDIFMITFFLPYYELEKTKHLLHKFTINVSWFHIPAHDGIESS